MNDEYLRQQAKYILTLADRADPFTKKRLLDLAERYDVPARRTPIPGVSVPGEAKPPAPPS
jgi:hypothetical protein